MKIRASLAVKLALVFSVGIATVVLFFSAFTMALMRYEAMQQQNEELLFYAQKIITYWDQTEKDMIRFEAELQIPYYISYSLFLKKADDIEILSSNDRFLPVFSPTGGKTLRYTEEDYYIDGNLSILYFVGLLEKTTISKLEKTYLQVSMNMEIDTAQKMIKTMPKIFIIIAIPLLLLSFFIGLVFVKRALRPVKNMTKTAQKISSENLNFRLITNESGDELDNLAKTFNELFFRLERDFKRERQFTSDVSHELKTPLAVITGHANLLRRWGKSDTVQLDKSIEAIIIESKSIQKIIENLLQLSRIENGPFITYKKNLSLKKLFERLKRDFAVLASDANIEICFPAGTHDYFVYADESMLYEIVTILINNSVKYTSGSAQIVLRATVINEVRKNDLYTNKNILKESNNDIAVSVIDYGKGIDPKALPHVFERFYQYDSARTRNNVIFDASSGSGLGLSIAKALTEAMGSKVFIESPVKTCDTGSFHQGTCVTIILPASIDLSTL